MTLLHAMALLLRFLPLAGILSIFFIGVLGRALLQRMRYGTYFLVRLQIAAEEDYLRLRYGEAYEAYARRVGRLMPRF